MKRSSECEHRIIPFDVQRVRDDFPVLHHPINGHPLTYLDSAASAQKPQAVIARVNHYYNTEHANVHRGVHQLSQVATRAYEDARVAVQKFINAAHSHEVLYTKGTTDGINLVAASYGGSQLAAEDEVIISTMEHHSNIVPWQMICQQRGAKLRVIPIDRAGQLDLAEFARMLTARTRMVAVAHVSNTLGTINPVAEMIRLAHAKGVVVLLDGAQAVPHFAVDVQELDVDFYVFSGHKLFAPTGIGILYGKTALLEAMPPYQGGGDMIERVTFAETTYNTLPHKFEAGTPSISAAIGLAAALEYLSQFDLRAITAHEQAILHYATEQLLSIDRLEIIGTAAAKTSVISFLLGGSHPFDVGAILDQQGVAVRTGHHCTQPLMDFYGIPGTVRASFALYNTTEDVDRLVTGLKKAAQMLL